MNGTEQITEAVLCQFCGTASYVRHWSRRLVMTDGVQWLAEHGCGWLTDAIASYQPKISAPFQVWQLRVADDRSAVLECREDTDAPVLVRQQIEFTDCPISLRLYICDGEVGGEACRVLMVPSEY